MIANATNLHGFAIQKEPAVDVKVKRANAQRRFVTIDHSSALVQLRHNPVDVRPLV